MNTPPTGQTRSSLAGCGATLGFLVAGWAVSFVFGPQAVWPALLVAIVAAVVVYRAMTYKARTATEARRREDERRQVERRAAERKQMLEGEKLRVGVAIAEHAAMLRTKRAQLRRPDEYGIVDEEPWLDHRYYFVDHVLKRQFPQLDQVTEDVLPQLIDEVLDDPYGESHLPAGADVNTMDGIAYEHHCADILTAHGWAASVTKASGDQGVDIIARRGELKVVLQCKRYASSVGNKAVQEVIAARQFEDATHAVVVSTAMYTDSARALAHKAQVYLIADTQLPQLWTLITRSK